MRLFGKILVKLGMGNAAAAGASPRPAPSRRPVAAPRAAPSGSAPALGTPPPAPVAVIDVVDVVAQLEQRAAAHSQELNWRTSIVDLLKVLDIDSSFGARKQLAGELGCPRESMADSAKMEAWVLKAVFARIASNGGNVPKELLD